MKEKYFKTETIDQRAEEFLKPLKSLRDKRNWTFNPASAALLVLDMQRYFLEIDSHAFIPAAKAIMPKIKRLQTLFLERNLPVIQTRHINNEENAGQMKKWWRELITADNPLSALSTELVDKRVTVLNKSRYDSFIATDLQRILTNREVKQLVITGVMTHLCCETTARSAFMRDFDVFFGIDTTATYNSDFHRSSLMNLSHGFAIPLLEAEIVEALTIK
jgi:isochorismate hydrolase